MNTAASYLESLQQAQPFPSSTLEDYRYSKIIELFHKTSINPESGKVWDTNHSHDYMFFSDQAPSDLEVKTPADLPELFHRNQHYFKNASLSGNSRVYYIPCTKETVSIGIACSEDTLGMQNIYFKIPDNKTVKIYLSLYSQNNSIAIPQIFLEAGENSHAELIYSAEQHQNSGILCPSFEFGAMGANSHISLQTFSTSIHAQRISLIGYCAGAESHIDLRSGFYLQQNELCDLFVRIFHEAPNSTSNQMIKTATLDSSEMNFNGQIYANKNAQNIYAYQMLKGIILGDNAQIFARPQLDIEYYELACSHGVSIGGFDPEELFYLKSRGIANKDIYSLLLYGFFTEPFVELESSDFWSNKIKSLLKVSIL
ncbi:MAG: SufB/SufD family protein [Brevinemataceae bacterium]